MCSCRGWDRDEQGDRRAGDHDGGGGTEGVRVHRGSIFLVVVVLLVLSCFGGLRCSRSAASALLGLDLRIGVALGPIGPNDHSDDEPEHQTQQDGRRDRPQGVEPPVLDGKHGVGGLSS